jgi:hypothetical protein
VLLAAIRTDEELDTASDELFIPRVAKVFYPLVYEIQIQINPLGASFRG